MSYSAITENKLCSKSALGHQRSNLALSNPSQFCFITFDKYAENLHFPHLHGIFLRKFPNCFKSIRLVTCSLVRTSCRLNIAAIVNTEGEMKLTSANVNHVPCDVSPAPSSSEYAVKFRHFAQLRRVVVCVLIDNKIVVEDFALTSRSEDVWSGGDARTAKNVSTSCSRSRWDWF